MTIIISRPMSCLVKVSLVVLPTITTLPLVTLTKCRMSAVRLVHNSLLFKPIALVPSTYATIKNKFSMYLFFCILQYLCRLSKKTGNKKSRSCKAALYYFFRISRSIYSFGSIMSGFQEFLTSSRDEPVWYFPPSPYPLSRIGPVFGNTICAYLRPITRGIV